MTHYAERRVAAHYGSAAGELAVCISRVGLALRTDLAVLMITGTPRGLDLLTQRVLHYRVAPRGAMLDGGAWWCRSRGRSQLVVICPCTRATRLSTRLRQDVNRLPRGSLVDVSESNWLFNVIGRHARQVLADIGVYGPTRDPRDAAPFVDAPVLGHRVSWLLAASNDALAIVETADAVDVWNALQAAGRTYAMGHVGLESLTRYRLIATRLVELPK
jgi:hypothetical protein